MLFMIIFWVLIAATGVAYLAVGKKERYENIPLILLMIAFSFLVVAIATKDPLFAGLGVPLEFEWVVGVAIVILSSWRFYFNPLKERVIKTENVVSSMKSEINSIKKDTTLMKEILLGGKVKFKKLRA